MSLLARWNSFLGQASQFILFTFFNLIKNSLTKQSTKNAASLQTFTLGLKKQQQITDSDDLRRLRTKNKMKISTKRR